MDAADFPNLDPAKAVILPHGFRLNNDGLWFQPAPSKKDAVPDPVWVCAALEIAAETADDTHHAHGLLLRWIDRNGFRHEWPMPRRMVHADGNLIAADLEDAGLSCGASRRAHELLKEFLQAVRRPRRVRCVERAGWHGPVYVLPNRRTFGAATVDVVLQTERAAASDAYAERGNLDGWQSDIARHAVGNDLLGLSISAAFAPPLLDVLGEPSGGLHLYGGSQIGKTTLLRCAISVYGPSDDEGMRTWRATANGLEAVAAATSDGLLILDEIAQANAREVGEVIYTLANSAGKARANRAGGARRHATWRSLFLSTGEVPLATKLSEAGLTPRPGQDVRMPGVPADAGAGMGVWQELHGFASGAALADHLRTAARTCCGTAGPAYLDQLARDRADDLAELVATLRGLREQFLEQHLPAGADGQVRSVAARFALIGAAGELATVYGVTGWPEGEALRAAGACFRRWLIARGGAGAAEDMRAVEAVRAFIALHGNSRFEAVGMEEVWDSVLKRKEETGEEVVDERRTVVNRAGWRRKVATLPPAGLGASDEEDEDDDEDEDRWEYCILPEIFRKEVCRGLDSGRVARVLAERGMLTGATRRYPADRVRIPGHGRLRLYRVPGAILSEDTP
jgi:putative DNA primase/helicase